MDLDILRAQLIWGRSPGSFGFFDQLTSLKVKYSFGVEVLVSAMGREHHSYARSAEVLKHVPFVFVIQRGRCFVQQEQFDAAKDRPSESQPLALSPREQDSVIADTGLEPEG